MILWLSLSLRFNFLATAALKKEAIDGPALLYLNDALVSRIPHLTTKQCIKLLDAVEQLKTEHKNWTGYDVFFSYRRSHSALVRLYALQMRGSFNCFIDMEGLTAGTFTEQILRRIDECRFFVVTAHVCTQEKRGEECCFRIRSYGTCVSHEDVPQSYCVAHGCKSPPACESQRKIPL